MGWWKAKRSLKRASKKAQRECVCGGEGVVSKSCVCSLEAPVSIIESTCQSEVHGELWEQRRTASSAHTGLGWASSYSDNKHSAFALLKPQHNRIAAQPGSVADVSLRIVLNLCLVEKLRIIGSDFASDADVNEDDEQRGRLLNALLRYRQCELQGPSLIYF